MTRSAVACAFVLTLLGCQSAAGSRCEGSCPSGYACVPDRFGESPGVCKQECERRSECPDGIVCRHEGAPRVCDIGGTLDIGAMCAGIHGQDPCGQGLACDTYTSQCRPACDPFSPHSEDRACPPDGVCDLTFTTSTCGERCDPTDPDACRPDVFQYCVRFEHPTEGSIALCVGQNGPWRVCEDGSECPLGEVCVGLTCTPYRDAAAVPYVIGPGVPPLID